MADPAALPARRPRRWRSLVLRLALCLLFGVAATLATAWGPRVAELCWPDRWRDWFGQTSMFQSDGTWNGALYRSLWKDDCLEGQGQSFPDQGFKEARRPPWAALTQSASDPLIESRAVHTQVTGFPLRSMRRFAVGDVGNYIWPGRGWEPAWSPVKPLWLGLLGDISVWSLVPALPLFAWPALRRHRRRRRGLCVSCGYPRDAARPGPCPECGI